MSRAVFPIFLHLNLYYPDFPSSRPILSSYLVLALISLADSRPDPQGNPTDSTFKIIKNLIQYFLLLTVTTINQETTIINSY